MEFRDLFVSGLRINVGALIIRIGFGGIFILL